MSRNSDNADIEIGVVVKRSTERAIKVNFGVKEEVWIPKSLIRDWVGESIDTAESIFIPEWIAREKGMI
jgi:hypothetical protein